MPTERKAKTTSTIIFTFNKNYKTVPIIMEIRYCFLLKLCLLFNENSLKKKIVFLQLTLVTVFPL